MVDESNNKAASSEAPTGCPVKGAGFKASSSADESRRGFFSGWFQSSSNSTNNNGSSSLSECPVKGGATPASIEEAANHSQLPAPGQRMPLSQHRVISTIPRGDRPDQSSNADAASNNNDDSKPAVPAHQPTNSSQWMYPSEQQFYNAMRKKGYNPPIESIPSVLKIHNAVNERSWMQVRKWEKELHDNEEPKLVKFVGRPKDLSPKAYFNSRVLMTQEPFDRHDWYVEDKDGGEPRRYVIDFYEGNEKSADIKAALEQQNQSPPIMKPPSMYIDVRPALDTPGAAVDRIVMAAREALPGLTAVFDSYKRS